MNVIWKYHVPVGPGVLDIPLPIGSEVIAVHEQNGLPTMWVLRRDSSFELSRKFTAVGTGHPISEANKYWGTAFCGEYVWHVFEVHQ